jgi:hypothetical protein
VQFGEVNYFGDFAQACAGLREISRNKKLLRKFRVFNFS